MRKAGAVELIEGFCKPGSFDVAKFFEQVSEPRDEGKLELVNIELFVVKESGGHDEGGGTRSRKGEEGRFGA